MGKVGKVREVKVMAVEILHFPVLGLRWVRYEGTLEATDVFATTQTVYVHVAGDLGWRSFVDLEAVTAVTVSFSHLHSATTTATAQLTAAGARLRLSCHAPTDLTFGIARMYQTMMGNTGVVEAYVSRDRDEALRWLGLQALPDRSEAAPLN